MPVTAAPSFDLMSMFADHGTSLIVGFVVACVVHLAWMLIRLHAFEVGLNSLTSVVADRNWTSLLGDFTWPAPADQIRRRWLAAESRSSSLHPTAPPDFDAAEREVLHEAIPFAGVARTVSGGLLVLSLLATFAGMQVVTHDLASAMETMTATTTAGASASQESLQAQVPDAGFIRASASSSANAFRGEVQKGINGLAGAFGKNVIGIASSLMVGIVQGIVFETCRRRYARAWAEFVALCARPRAESHHRDRSIEGQIRTLLTGLNSHNRAQLTEVGSRMAGEVEKLGATLSTSLASLDANLKHHLAQAVQTAAGQQSKVFQTLMETTGSVVQRNQEEFGRVLGVLTAHNARLDRLTGELTAQARRLDAILEALKEQRTLLVAGQECTTALSASMQASWTQATSHVTASVTTALEGVAPAVERVVQAELAQPIARLGASDGPVTLGFARLDETLGAVWVAVDALRESAIADLARARHDQDVVFRTAMEVFEGKAVRAVEDFPERVRVTVEQHIEVPLRELGAADGPVVQAIERQRAAVAEVTSSVATLHAQVERVVTQAVERQTLSLASSAKSFEDGPAAAMRDAAARVQEVTLALEAAKIALTQACAAFGTNVDAARVDTTALRNELVDATRQLGQVSDRVVLELTSFSTTVSGVSTQLEQTSSRLGGQLEALGATHARTASSVLALDHAVQEETRAQEITAERLAGLSGAFERLGSLVADASGVNRSVVHELGGVHKALHDERQALTILGDTLQGGAATHVRVESALRDTVDAVQGLATRLQADSDLRNRVIERLGHVEGALRDDVSALRALGDTLRDDTAPHGRVATGLATMETAVREGTSRQGETVRQVETVGAALATQGDTLEDVKRLLAQGLPALTSIEAALREQQATQSAAKLAGGTQQRAGETE